MIAKFLYVTSIDADLLELPDCVQVVSCNELSLLELEENLSNTKTSPAIALLDDSSAWLYPSLRSSCPDAYVVFLFSGTQEMLYAFDESISGLTDTDASFKARFPVIGLANGLFRHSRSFFLMEEKFTNYVLQKSDLHPSRVHTRNSFTLTSPLSYVPILSHESARDFIFFRLFFPGFTEKTITDCLLSNDVDSNLILNESVLKKKALLSRVKAGRRGLLIEGAAAIQGLPVDGYGTQRVSLVLTSADEDGSTFGFPLGLLANNRLQGDEIFRSGFSHSGFGNLGKRSIAYTDLPFGRFYVSIRIERHEGVFDLVDVECDPGFYFSKTSTWALVSLTCDESRLILEKHEYRSLPLGSSVARTASNVVVCIDEEGRAFATSHKSLMNKGRVTVSRMLEQFSTIRPQSTYKIYSFDSSNVTLRPLRSLVRRDQSVQHRHKVQVPVLFIGLTMESFLRTLPYLGYFDLDEENVFYFSSLSEYFKASLKFSPGIRPIIFFDVAYESLLNSYSEVQLRSFNVCKTKTALPLKIAELLCIFGDFSFVSSFDWYLVVSKPAREVIFNGKRSPIAFDYDKYVKAHESIIDEVKSKVPDIRLIDLSSDYRAVADDGNEFSPFTYESHFNFDLIEKVFDVVPMDGDWR